MSVITTDRGGGWTGGAGLSHSNGPETRCPACYPRPSLFPPEEGKWGASWQIWTPFFAGWTLRLQWVHYAVLLKRGQPGAVVVVGCGGGGEIAPSFVHLAPWLQLSR